MAPGPRRSRSTVTARCRPRPVSPRSSPGPACRPRSGRARDHRSPRTPRNDWSRPMATELWWYVARSGGILAWVMLAAGVIWGLLLSTRVLGRRPRPAWLLDLHRFFGACAVVFVAIHVIAIVLDSYVHFGLADVLVPFASS